jgi:uncharacterized protein with GYD domain
MATYVTLYRYTDEGIKQIKRAPEIARGWMAEADRRGVKIKELYWLQGSADAVTVLEADNEDAVNSLMLAIGAQGFLRTETMRGISLEDLTRSLNM